MALDWVPETYPRSGGLAAAGFYKLLGRPRLDPLAVLVRETAQNSWDAREHNGQPVRYHIHGRDLLDTEQRALHDKVFTDAPKATGTGLAEALVRPGIQGLYISDRNTLGLGGPVQADEADADDVYDWVDFVLNVGKANTAGQTGGTYGFGKTISYIVSSANTVVIHTHTRHKGRIRRRLIACAIGDEFTFRRKLRTGRHWWGAESDGNPEPVTGATADRLAKQIGMPEFVGDDCGTNLLIVAPDFGGRTPEQAMRFVAESVTWHLWPKMIHHGRSAPMTIGVTWNGDQVDIPAPAERPPLHGFAQAFRVLLADGARDQIPPGARLDRIRCLRPKTDVGDLVTVPLVQRPRAEVDDGHSEAVDSPGPAAMINGVCHHVALLRSPELVVEYLEGPAPPEGGTEWAGVFRCFPEHDGKFATAEPPTHDSWSPELLPKGQSRTIVNVGLREIRKTLDDRWSPRPTEPEPQAASTAVIADGLAHLVRSTDGLGKGRTAARSGGGGGRASAAKVEVVSAGPIRHEGRIATKVVVAVRHRKGSAGTRLHVATGAALDGSSSDPSLDTEMHLVRASWSGTTMTLSGLQATLDLEGTAATEVEIIVARSDSISVLLDLNADAIELR